MQAAQDEIRHPRVGMGEENHLEIITKILVGWESILYGQTVTFLNHGQVRLYS